MNEIKEYHWINGTLNPPDGIQSVSFGQGILGYCVYTCSLALWYHADSTGDKQKLSSKNKQNILSNIFWFYCEKLNFFFNFRWKLEICCEMLVRICCEKGVSHCTCMEMLLRC